MKFSVLSVAALVLGASVSAAAAPPPAIPPNAPRVVRNHLAELRDMCLQVGGAPDPSSLNRSIIRHDFNGDGRRDWAIREGVINCVGAEAIYVGNSGGQLVIYVVRPNGSGFLAFRHGISIAGVVRQWRPSGWQFSVGVGGPLCGQRVTPATPRSDMIPCMRPLRWNAALRQVEFAPLSEVVLTRW